MACTTVAKQTYARPRPDLSGGMGKRQRLRNRKRDVLPVSNSTLKSDVYHRRAGEQQRLLGAPTTLALPACWSGNEPDASTTDSAAGFRAGDGSSARDLQRARRAPVLPR